MMKYTREQIEEHVQWLIDFMRDEYPNEFELRINSIGANIMFNNTIMSFISNSYQKELQESIEKHADNNILSKLFSCCCCEPNPKDDTKKE